MKQSEIMKLNINKIKNLLTLELRFLQTLIGFQIRWMKPSFRKLIAFVTNKDHFSFSTFNVFKKTGKAAYEMTGTMITSESTVTKK